MPDNVFISGSLVVGQRYLMRSSREGYDEKEYIAVCRSTGVNTGQLFFNLINIRLIGTEVWFPFKYTNFCFNRHYNLYDLCNTQGRKLTGFTKFLKNKGL